MGKKLPPPPSDMVVQQSKVCSKCNLDLPLTAMHFDRDRSHDDGFKSICKVCRSQREKAAELDEVTEKVAALDELSMAMLCEAASNRGAAIPHSAELYESLVNIFGGPDRIAQHVMATFLTAPQGSKQRIQILQEIFRLGRAVSESGLAKRSLEQMGLDDLEREMQIEMQRASQKELQRRALPPMPTSPAIAVHDVTQT